MLKPSDMKVVLFTAILPAQRGVIQRSPLGVVDESATLIPTVLLTMAYI